MATVGGTQHQRAGGLGQLRALLNDRARGFSAILQKACARELAAYKSWLPPALTGLFASRFLVCRYAHGELALLVCEGSNEEQIGAISLAEEETLEQEIRDQIARRGRNCDVTVLELAEDALLHVSVSLPLATESNLRQVLAFEMNRLTPFRSDQVRYDYCVRRRDPDAGKLHVDLYFIPTDRMDWVLDRCAQIGIEPRQIRRRTDSGGSQPTALLQSHQGAGGIPRRWLNPSLFGMAGLLAIAVLLSPLLIQRHTLVTLQQDLEVLQREAAEVGRIREQVQQRIEVPQTLVQSQVRRRTMIEVLSELTDMVPEHTWLRSVRIQGGRVMLQGESERATALPALLEEGSAFANARFDAPVTSTPRSDRDAFTISTELAQRNDG